MHKEILLSTNIVGTIYADVGDDVTTRQMDNDKTA